MFPNRLLDLLGQVLIYFLLYQSSDLLQHFSVTAMSSTQLFFAIESVHFDQEIVQGHRADHVAVLFKPLLVTVVNSSSIQALRKYFKS